ncbi:MAG: hypothetical protein NWQ32_19635, partial [Paracoccaceae bacterium]|nr:hypothetical protein [Paracoccaceae bacterium]
MIETQAVRVIGPDPADIGGIAELKWVAEHAYMHSILMAPHGTANGLLGLGAFQHGFGLGLGHGQKCAHLRAHAGVVHLGLFGGADQRQNLFAIGGGLLADGAHLFLGLGPGGGRGDRLGLGMGFLDALGRQTHGVFCLGQRGRQFGGKALFAQFAVLADLGQAHLAFAGDPCRLAPLFGCGLFLGGFGHRTRARDLDLALLGDHRLFFLAANGQLALGGHGRTSSRCDYP